MVDQSGEAEKAGLRMQNTKQVIFGSPKAGTPLMLAVPSIFRSNYWSRKAKSGSHTTRLHIFRHVTNCPRNYLAP